jgi:hypothetical protein
MPVRMTIIKEKNTNAGQDVENGNKVNFVFKIGSYLQDISLYLNKNKTKQKLQI